MKKNVRKGMLILYAAGLLIFSVSSMLRGSLSAFALGFCEGVSIVLLLCGFVTIAVCLIRRQNPFDFKSN